MSLAEAAILVSIAKPILFLIILMAWAWTVGQLDKDAEYFHIQRFLWAGGHLACGVVGLGLLLWVPIFWIGLPLAILILGGGVGGYIYYRNQHVPESRKWQVSTDIFHRKAEQMRQAQAQRAASIRLLTRDETPLEVPESDDPNREPFLALNNAIDFALPRDAQQIDLRVEKEKVTVTAKIDGVRYSLTNIEQPVDMDPDTAMQLINYLKGVAGLDVDDRRRKQRGELKVDHNDLGRHTLDLQTAGSTRGLTLSMAIDPAAQVNVPLDTLGFSSTQLEGLRPVLQESSHVVIVAAPSRQGLTTTLYTLIDEHDPYTSSVQSFEHKIEREVEGVSHQKVEPGLSNEQYNDKLAAMLRMDPDVFLLSHLADSKTAKLVVDSSEDTRIYLPMEQTGDTFGALKTWLKAVGDSKKGAAALAAVIVQRLVRRLCPNCKQGYKPDPEALRKLNLSKDKVSRLYRASGQIADERDRPQTCPLCHGMGYRGRIGIFEMMIVDSQARSHIASNEADRLRSHLRKNKMVYLQEAALGKVVEGITDIKEVTRVMNENQSPDATSTSSTAKKAQAQ